MSQAKELYEKGLEAQRRGKLQEALKLYRASVKSDPGFRPAYNNLGALYSRSGRPDLALGFFKLALELGEDAAVYFNLGSESYRLEKWKESRQYLVRALKLDPRLTRAHILLAYLYEKEGEHRRAWIYFQNALKVEPANRMALLGYAVSLSENEEHERALAAIDSFRGNISGDETLKNLRAGLLLRLNRIQDSFQEYKTLTEESPRYLSFTDHLKKARTEKSESYDRIFSGVDDKIRERTARLKERMARRKALLEKARKSGASSPPAAGNDELKEMVDLSLLHLFNGDPDKALRFLLQAKKMKGGQ